MNHRISIATLLAVFAFIFPATTSASLAQAAGAAALEETFWAGTDSAGSPFTFEFKKSGKFRYVPTTGIVSQGKWKHIGDAISIEINGGFVKLRGTVDNDQMKGEAVNKRGLEWTWVAIEQPPVISNAAPHYPAIAVAARATGDVIVEVNINPDGGVSAVRSLSGHPLLRQASEAAAQLWKFAPAADFGKGRAARVMFSFRILDNEKDEKKVISPIFLSPYQAEIRRIPPVLNTLHTTADRTR